MSGEAKLAAAVLEDFRDELDRMLAAGRLGVHQRQLLYAMCADQLDLCELLRYGMSRLAVDDGRPDDALAAFFTVLSEFKRSPPALRIFATKCVEYCESEALDGWSESLPQLRAAYKTLASQLVQIPEY